MTHYPKEVCPRHEGAGVFAPALGGGSGANRIAGDPGFSFETVMAKCEAKECTK